MGRFCPKVPAFERGEIVEVRRTLRDFQYLLQQREREDLNRIHLGNLVLTITSEIVEDLNHGKPIFPSMIRELEAYLAQTQLPTNSDISNTKTQRKPL